MLYIEALRFCEFHFIQNPINAMQMKHFDYLGMYFKQSLTINLF